MKYTAVPCLFLILLGNSLAEVPMRQRVVDLVFLKDGTRLLGAVVENKRGQPVQMLVRGQWLKANAAEAFERLEDSAEVTEAANGVADLIRQYIATLQSQPNPDQNRIGYLEERLIDLTAQVASGPGDVPELVLLSLPPKSVRRVVIQNTTSPQLALISILNQVDNVEDVSKAEVVSQLQQIPAAQLLRQLPAAQPGAKADNEAQQEFQRLLLNTDRVLGTTCRLIKQSGQYLSEKNASAADLQALSAEMMLGQVQSQLQSLLSEDFTKPAGGGGAVGGASLRPPSQLPASAILLADKENADVVEVTEMALNPTQGTAQVVIALYHKGPSAPIWKLLTSVQGKATSRDTTVEQQQKIAGDARVQQITQLFSGLGVGGGNISKAVSIGACVEIAQQRAREALQNAFATGGAASSAAGLRIMRGTLAEAADQLKP